MRRTKPASTSGWDQFDRWRREHDDCLMKAGRNDSCPCGSGKKYGKCCLNEATRRSAPAPPDAVEPRFFSPATSYYPPAALAEAMKPGGMLCIHRYVLLKMRSDPRLVQAASPEDRVRLPALWHPAKLAAMSNEEIEDRLRLLGLQSERARFVDTTAVLGSAWAVAETWPRDGRPLSTADRDCVGLAACELWRRFCPDRPSLEMVDDWLCEGYAFVARGDRATALRSWWRVWETLQPCLKAQMHGFRQAGELLFPQMSQCLSNWSVDFRLETLNAARQDPVCGELGIRFIQGLLAVLPAEDDHLNLSADLAMLCFAVGREAEAEQCCQRLTQDHPDRAVGYVVLSDALVHRASTGQDVEADLERALQLLERAAAYPVKDADSFDVSARLKDARELLSDSVARSRRP